MHDDLAELGTGAGRLPSGVDEGVQQRQLDDGLSMDVIYNEPILLLIEFLLTRAVAWTTLGLVPLVKQFISGVAIGMFVMLSMPSSSGAIPKELVPTFFQSLHRFLPLGQAVDSMRGVLYFNGAGALPAVLGLVA